MVRKFGAVLLLAMTLVLIKTPASADPLSPAGWDTIGPYEPGESDEMSCVTRIGAPEGGAIGEIGPGATINARCLGRSLADGDDVPAEDLRRLESISFAYWAEEGDGLYSFDAWEYGEAETDLACTQDVGADTESLGSGWIEIRCEVLPGAPSDTIRLASGVYWGVQVYDSSPGVSIESSHSSRWSGSPVEESPRSKLVGGAGMPPWPAMWPDYSLAPPDTDTSANMPDPVCRVELRELVDGTVRGNFIGAVENPVGSTVGEDVVGWSFSWEASDLADFLTTGPTRMGSSRINGVTVPTDGQPEGGWYATYTVTRTLNPDYYGIGSSVPEGWIWNEEFDQYMPDLTIQEPGIERAIQMIFGDTAITDIDEFELLGLLGISLGTAAEVGELLGLGDDDVVWTTATTRCSLRVDALAAGYGEADTTADPTPPGTEPTLPDDDGDGWPDDDGGDPPGGGGEGSCPSAGGVLDMINPTNWLDMITCGLGSLLSDLFDLLWEIFDALIEAIGTLFIPEESFGERLGAIGTAFEGTPIGDLPGMFTGMADAVSGSIADADGGTCEGPTLTFAFVGEAEETYEPFNACDGPAEDVRNLIYPLCQVVISLGAIKAIWNLTAGRFGAQKMDTSA